MINILVVEDEKNLNKIVCTHLDSNGYGVKGCYSANEAYDAMNADMYDLIISDIMMPDIDGFEFAETVRSLNKTIPILFMTALDGIASKQKGFNAGIDDYMVKPIDLDELVLRISALLRRANIIENKKMVVGNLTLNADELSASIDSEDIPITVREFSILYKLLSYPKKPFSRSQLMNEFWDIENNTNIRSVDVYINKLREKFSDCDGFEIVTVHRLGYKAVLLNE